MGEALRSHSPCSVSSGRFRSSSQSLRWRLFLYFPQLTKFPFQLFSRTPGRKVLSCERSQSALQKYSHPLDIVTFSHFKATNIMGFIENAQLKPEVYIYQKETHIHMFSSPSKVKSDQISCLWKSNDANYHPNYTITTSCSQAVFVNKGREGDHL